MEKTVIPVEKITGEITVAADKSISHRAVIFSALAQGNSAITNFLRADDTMSSVNCMRQLGVEFDLTGAKVQVKSAGISGLQEPATVMDCGNSGTTMRLLTGLLSSCPFFSVLTGDESLSRRPMGRVIEPLSLMGAEIWGRDNDTRPPLAIKGGRLGGIDYQLPVASAQVKSALLLAGLMAVAPTRLQEPLKSRDHTERMLAAMGADIKVEGNIIKLNPIHDLRPQDFVVPGDISSAAFFLVAGSLVGKGELMLKQIGINPTRAGIITVLQQMGANLKLENRREEGGELIADIIVAPSCLQGIDLSPELLPSLIDEIPVLAVAMCCASGSSKVTQAGELRVKETDRITAICQELKKMGADIIETQDGFIIQGNPGGLSGALVSSQGDHRIAMSLAVAGLLATGETRISGAEAVGISFPEFWTLLDSL